MKCFTFQHLLSVSILFVAHFCMKNFDVRIVVHYSLRFLVSTKKLLLNKLLQLLLLDKFLYFIRTFGI